MIFSPVSILNWSRSRLVAQQLLEENPELAPQVIKIICTYTCVCCLFFCIICAMVTFWVYATAFLVSDYKVAHECEPSWVWEFVLTMLLWELLCNPMSTMFKFFITEYPPHPSLLSGLWFGWLVYIFVIVWGSYEIFESTKECSELKHSGLYIIAYIQFVDAIVSAVVTTCVLGCFYSHYVPPSDMVHQSFPDHRVEDPYPSHHQSHTSHISNYQRLPVTNALSESAGDI